MLPLLLALDGIIWYGVLRNYKTDKAQGPYPENPSFDPDLDKLWDAANPWASRPKLSVIPDKKSDLEEDLLFKRDFEQWLEQERNKDQTLEDYLWKEGILNPEEVIWCNGTPLTPYDPEDMKKFMEIKNMAYLQGEYNSKPLEEGGLDDLYKAWFMLKGCSDYGAEQLLAMGTKPWNFEL